MWENFLLFMEIYPELWLAVYLVIGYVALPFLVRIVSWACIHLRKGPPPYIDEIVHIVSFVGFLLMSLAVIGCVVRLYYQPMYLLSLEVLLVYGVLFVISLMCWVALVPRLRSA
jgi:hypothetical protein